MGGPASYTDEHLEHVHQRYGITLAEFNEMIELLTETLEDVAFPADDVARVGHELRRREPVIVNER